MIENVFVKNISGPKSYLIKDEEAYIVTKLEIYCAPGLPRDIVILTNEIQQVLYDVGKKGPVMEFNPNPHKGMTAYSFKL